MSPPTPAPRPEESAAEWTGAAKDTWYRDHEETDMPAPDAPVTHIVTYRPAIRIRVLIPPWIDPDEWFARAQPEWDDWLVSPLEVWTEPAGEALIDVEVVGSTASCSAVEVAPLLAGAPAPPGDAIGDGSREA